MHGTLILQTEITMKIYLTLGHALSAAQRFDAALKSYTKCLDLAETAEDVSHQSKAFVNIATLHINRGKFLSSIAGRAYFGFNGHVQFSPQKAMTYVAVVFCILLTSFARFLAFDILPDFHWIQVKCVGITATQE